MTRWLACVALALAALARADDAPQTLARVRLDPPGPVVTGQLVRLRVDVLTSTFFTGAPQYPPLDVDGASVTLSDEPAQKLTETHDGVTWFGLSRSYLVTPTRGGSIQIPVITVTVFPGPGGAATAVDTTPLALVVKVAPRPAGAENAVGATRLAVTQTLDRPLTGLRVGDSVKRTIEVSADGVRAMFLPPTTFPAAKGLSVYPAQPDVTDVASDRGDFTGGRRVDAATYIVQEAGSYELPAVTVEWWDTSANQLRTATAPAVKFSAAPNPDYHPELALPAEEPPSRRPEDLLRAGAVAGGLAVLGVVAWLVVPYLRRAMRDVAEQRAERRRRYEASEEFAFQGLRRAGRSGERETYVALTRWLARFRPGLTIGEFCSAAGDPKLTTQIDALEARLYRDAPTSHDWSATALLAGVARARARLSERAHVAASPALPPLNPI